MDRPGVWMGQGKVSTFWRVLFFAILATFHSTENVCAQELLWVGRGLVAAHVHATHSVGRKRQDVGEGLFVE